MIYFHVISQEIDNPQSTILPNIDNPQSIILPNIDNPQIENVSKQPFWSFLLKEYKIFRFISFKFNLLAVGVVCFSISSMIPIHDIHLGNAITRQFVILDPDIKWYEQIRIALNILLLPCMAFYLMQIPFKLKHFWLYFFLVFLFFFLLFYALPRMMPIHDKNPICWPIFGYGIDRHRAHPDPFMDALNYVVLVLGILLFFKFPYNHWVFFPLVYLFFVQISVVLSILSGKIYQLAENMSPGVLTGKFSLNKR